MRPAIPNMNFAQAGPSSPPQTPTTTTYPFGVKNRRHGIHFPQQFPPQNGNILPNGTEPGLSFIPPQRPADLSPRSSSPESSAQSSTSDSPPRSLTSSPAEALSSSPPRHKTVLAEGNFIVEEFGDSDYEDWDSDGESVIRPHQYEDAESDHARSVKSAAHNDLDSKIYTSFRNLHCQNDDFGPEMDTEAWLKKMQAEKRRKRRSSSSVQKRTLSQSIGSDTDEEDLLPMTFEGANEAGSSARRLRRKVGNDRTSLVFDDPPPRIDELEEPESCEEVVEVKGSEEEDEGRGVFRELPYYVQDMDVDSDDEF